MYNSEWPVDPSQGASQQSCGAVKDAALKKTCEVSSSAHSGCWSKKLWPGALRLAQIFSYVGMFNEFTFDEVNILAHELVDRLPVIIYLHRFPMSPLLLVLADAGKCYAAALEKQVSGGDISLRSLAPALSTKTSGGLCFASSA